MDESDRFWNEALRAALRETRERLHSRGACPVCGGDGVEVEDGDDEPASEGPHHGR
jgi:hypothetical protein